MKTFDVIIPVSGTQTIRIKARNEKQAIKKVFEGEGDMVDSDYENFSPNCEDWEVEEVSE